jgi:transcriptional regulator with XRE-family HTH domain
MTLLPYATLAEAIEATRLAKNIHPAEAARQMGVTATQLSRWRRGGGISIDQLAKVATWMAVPLGELQVLAGFPAPSAIDMSSDVSDPRLQAIADAWPVLDEPRRNILLELAQRGAGIVRTAIGASLENRKNWLRSGFGQRTIPYQGVHS